MGQSWLKKLPLCLVGSGVDDASDLAEARHLACCELDLIEEEEEVAADYSAADVKSIRQWLSLTAGNGKGET